MHTRLLAALVVPLLCLSSLAYSAGRMVFWNLTSSTITDLQLAPPGTDAWGTNQCTNDPDGAVDADERLKLTGIKPGRYDVKLTQKTGRTCIVRNVQVNGSGAYAFSLEERDLRECSR